MDLVAVIRHKVLTEGVPIREVARELGLSRNTIRRYARAKAIPIDRPLPVARSSPATTDVGEAATAIWQARRSFTAGKQRLTATRLWELLREAGHTASERTVRRLVARLRNAEREVTVPLVYGPGELAQVDFFEVWIELGGARQKAWLFVMRLMHSGRDFAMFCAQQDTTWFLAAHVAAFAHFAGVIAAVAYDTSEIVSRARRRNGPATFTWHTFESRPLARHAPLSHFRVTARRPRAESRRAAPGLGTRSGQARLRVTEIVWACA